MGDIPSLKLVGNPLRGDTRLQIDPSDLEVDKVGDCWLLSAIAGLAEFDGAVHKLFARTNGGDLDPLPLDTPNTYTVTLHDLATWEPVDITVDERLAAKSEGGGMLGCNVSEDGALWICYLEKAVAVHCGGWDQINGGYLPHAFSLLTGCKNVRTCCYRQPIIDCLIHTRCQWLSAIPSSLSGVRNSGPK